MSDMHKEEHFPHLKAISAWLIYVPQRWRAQKTPSGHDVDSRNKNRHEKCEVITPYNEVSALLTALVWISRSFRGPLF